ncbi:DNA polymerase III subunit delta [Spirochaeta africana]|uniref:DNA-directed DNA polymerase n=1 Tax=Spirochaeta africana (strain ATCC 700263 / DSM 8902 / Z-7692) TaxID=889378 RepID=H9UME6_SPIAZ|nr:DNA polymerase III subunit delta [Spirochaeta africana]AFG38689.1 DNA polymerase III, delta subunit [Spirochaeta africana DSM 8902]
MSALHLLLGPEDGKKQEYLQALQAGLTKRLGQAPDRVTMYAGEQSIGDAVTLLRNGSLFNPHQLLLFYGAESIKSQDDLALLARYAKSPSPEGTLVLLSAETKVSRKVEGAVPKSQVKIFWELFENQKEQFIQRYLRDHGRRIEQDALLLLLETIENTTDQMRSACDLLLSLFPRDSVITEEGVDAFLFHSKQESVFTLFRAIGQRDREHSLEILHTLLELQDMKPFQIVAGVSWQLRRLLSAKERLQRGQAPADVWAELKIRGKRNQEQMLRAARAFSLPELQERLRLTAEADGALRSDRSGIHHHLMTLFVYRLT